MSNYRDPSFVYLSDSEDNNSADSNGTLQESSDYEPSDLDSSSSEDGSATEDEDGRTSTQQHWSSIIRPPRNDVFFGNGRSETGSPFE